METPLALASGDEPGRVYTIRVHHHHPCPHRSPPPRNTPLSSSRMPSPHPMPPPRAANTRHAAFLLFFLRFYFSSVSSFPFFFLFLLSSIFLPTFLPSPNPLASVVVARAKAISRVITASIATSVTRRTELHLACRPTPLLIASCHSL